MNRRNFLGGLIATPAIVAASSLMPIRGIVMPIDPALPPGAWRTPVGAYSFEHRGRQNLGLIRQRYLPAGRPSRRADYSGSLRR